MSADPFFDEDGAVEPGPYRWVAGGPGPLDAVSVIHRRDHPFKKKPEGKKGCDVCGRGKLRLVHHGNPGTFNAFGSGANRFAYQGTKKLWQERLTELLDEAGLPRGLGRVFVEGEMCFPTRQKRDQGNYRFILEKALGDALKEGGWLEDDHWACYEFGALRATYEKGEAWTRLTFFPEWPGEEPDPAQGSLL